jgi:hypothetical protein
VPSGPPLTSRELDLRAALLQTVARARAREFAGFTDEQRQALLDEFDRVAVEVRLDRGWISSRRGGQLNEALALGDKPASARTVWLNGKLVRGGSTRHTTIPDEAMPPVRAQDLADGSVEHTARLWIERKSYTFDTSTGKVDSQGVLSSGKDAARTHLREARGDLTNLPPGATIALEYASDPGPVTRAAMAEILFQEPLVVYVKFGALRVSRPVTRP